MAQVDTDRRRAPRQPASLPLRLLASGRMLRATTVNVSASGVLLRLPLDELGLSPEDDAADIARRVTDSLGDLVIAEFHPDQFGSLVRKGLRLVRIAFPDGHDDTVEVGCALRDQLTDDEMRLLGLVDGAPYAPIDVEAFDNDSLEVTVVLCASEGRAARPLLGRALRLSEAGARMHVSSTAREGLLPQRATVSNVLGTLTARYGGRPLLVLLRHGYPVWSVTSRLMAAVVDRRTGRVDLELAFSDQPDAGTSARLGLGQTPLAPEDPDSDAPITDYESEAPG